MADDLKPCPFCGCDDQETLMIEHLEGTRIHPAYRVVCDNCGASIRYTDQDDHVQLWNTRPAPTLAEALAVPEVKAMRTFIANISAQALIREHEADELALVCDVDDLQFQRDCLIVDARALDDVIDAALARITGEAKE